MKNVIENICIICEVISIIGFIISLAINNICAFSFSVLFMFAFLAIALIDMSRK